MKAVVSVLGKDMVGILSDVSNECAKANANVLEVTQTIIQDMFAMFMRIYFNPCTEYRRDKHDQCK